MLVASAIELIPDAGGSFAESLQDVSFLYCRRFFNVRRPAYCTRDLGVWCFFSLPPMDCVGGGPRLLVCGSVSVPHSSTRDCNCCLFRNPPLCLFRSPYPYETQLRNYKPNVRLLRTGVSSQYDTTSWNTTGLPLICYRRDIQSTFWRPTRQSGWGK